MSEASLPKRRRSTRLRYPGALALLAWAVLAGPASHSVLLGASLPAQRRAALAALRSEPGSPATAGAPCLERLSTWWIPPGLLSHEARALLPRIAWAAGRGDDEALGILARQGAAQGLDPWLVLDELLGLGLTTSAARYAQHVPRQRRELLEHVGRTGSLREDPAARRQLVRAARQHFGDAIPPTGEAPRAIPQAAPGSLLALRLRAAHAAAACRHGQLEEGAAVLSQVAHEAHTLGWWSAARCAWSEAADVARQVGRCELEAEHLGRLVVLSAERGTAAEQVEALVRLAGAEEQLGDGPQALRHLFEAVRLAEAACDLPLAGAAHSLSMEILTQRGALCAALESRELADRAFAAGHVAGSRRGEHLLRVAALETALGRTELADGALRRAARELEEACDPELALRLLLERAALEVEDLRFVKGATTRSALLGAQQACAELGARASPLTRRRLAWLESVHALAAWERGTAGAERAALEPARLKALALEAEAAACGRRGAALAARCLAARLAEALGQGGQRVELEAVARAAERLRLLPIELDALTALARAHLRAGALQAAIVVSREAFQHAAELARGLPDAQRAALQGRLGTLCRVALEVAAAGAAGPLPDDAAALWLELLETRQASALQQALGSHQLFEDAGGAQEPPATVEQRARVRRDAFSALTAQQASGDVSDRGLDRLRRQETRYASALRAEQAELVEWERSALRDARAEALAPLDAGLDELRAALPRGAAYVAYALLEEEAWALVVTSESARPRRLGAGAEQMQALRSALENVAAATAQEGAPSLEGPAAEAARLTLRRRLLEPLGLAPQIRTLVVAPDPALVFVPWAWVLGPETALDVALEPSATAFTWLATRNDPPGRGTLAVGNPAYPDRLGLGASVLRAAERGTPSAVLPTFRPLPYSLDEARAAASRPGDRLLVGEEANEEAFWTTLASRGPRHRWRSVHFAVHGLVDPEHPALALLALAPSAQEDGLLTLAEIQRHRIPADLVVLSACRTARGRVADGEGLLGLCRGFLMAGATQVIASLWDVPDAPTAELMLELRAHLDAGLDAARALREAQASVRASHPDPAAWAAWVLWGVPTGPGAVAAGPVR